MTTAEGGPTNTAISARGRTEYLLLGFCEKGSASVAVIMVIIIIISAIIISMII